LQTAASDRATSMCFETDVDDAGVGARGEHGGAPAADLGREEALVVDLRVRDDLVAAPCVVPCETGFVGRQSGDVTAREQEVRDDVHVGARDDLPAGRCDGVEGGFGWKHREDVERREDAALVGSVGVDVDDERRAAGPAARGGDRGDDGREGPGVIPVPVRQEQHVDGRQVERQALGVGEPDVAVGADVEQDRRRAVSPSGGRKRREAVARRGGRSRPRSRDRRAGRSAECHRGGMPAPEAAAPRWGCSTVCRSRCRRRS
jgi:hypothetical protein